MAAQIVTLLFIDLAGSAALLQRLGDEAGEAARCSHLGIPREELAKADGQEIKDLGDGLMVAFDSAVAACRRAISMRRGFERHHAPGGSQPGVGLGVHVGEPVRDEDDRFGAAVVAAKRLRDAAEAEQILVSGRVRVSCRRSQASRSGRWATFRSRASRSRSIQSRWIGKKDRPERR